MRRFQLMLDDDLFDQFKIFFAGHGVRQAALRQSVKDLVRKAKTRYNESGEIVFDVDDLKLLGDK